MVDSEATAKANAALRNPASFQQKPPFHFLQIWLLLTCSALFMLWVAWDQNLLSMVFRLDRSYMAMLITLFAFLGSIYAAWHLFRCSTWIQQACCELAAEDSQSSRRLTPDKSLVHAFANDLNLVDHRQSSAADSADSLLEIYADQLRSPVQFGWFMVDLAIRMGLLGTIIGFILIFTSLSDTSLSAGTNGAEGLSELLVLMSGGMGTALFTTLTGLVVATYLNLQFLILGRAVEHLIGLLVRIRHKTNTISHGD